MHTIRTASPTCRIHTEMGGHKKKKEIKPAGPPLMKPPSDRISSSDSSILLLPIGSPARCGASIRWRAPGITRTRYLGDSRRAAALPVFEADVLGGPSVERLRSPDCSRYLRVITVRFHVLTLKKAPRRARNCRARRRASGSSSRRASRTAGGVHTSTSTRPTRRRSRSRSCPLSSTRSASTSISTNTRRCSEAVT